MPQKDLVLIDNRSRLKYLAGLKRILSGLAGLSALSIALRMLPRFGLGTFDLIRLAWVGIPAAAALLLIWFALRGTSKSETQIILSGWRGGFIGSVVGFILGFVIVPIIGSIITGRDLAQAPLMGIFVTGPAGFPIGVLIGVLIEIWSQSRRVVHR